MVFCNGLLQMFEVLKIDTTPSTYIVTARSENFRVCELLLTQNVFVFITD